MNAVAYLQENGSNGEIGWLLYLLLSLLLLAVIILWLRSRRRGGQVEASSEVHVRHEENIATDDLVRIEGIGPRVARILNEAGISTFDALANADAAEIQKTLSAAGLQMMNPEGWIEQAGLAARGDWAALEKMQHELKGGRRK